MQKCSALFDPFVKNTKRSRMWTSVCVQRVVGGRAQVPHRFRTSSTHRLRTGSARSRPRIRMRSTELIPVAFWLSVSVERLAAGLWTKSSGSPEPSPPPLPPCGPARSRTVAVCLCVFTSEMWVLENVCVLETMCGRLLFS